MNAQMRREDISVFTSGGMYELYCNPAGEPRACACVYLSYDRCDWQYVNMQHWQQKYYCISIYELRGVKYLLWHYLRAVTERAVWAFALALVPDVARVIAFTILRSDKEYQRMLFAIDAPTRWRVNRLLAQLRA